MSKSAIKINSTVQPASDKDGEAALIARLRSGEAAACNELCNIYLDRVYSHVFNSVGKDRALTQDIVQDVFLGALKSIRQFRGDSGLYTWLVSIACRRGGR
jgi:DNA-directed RNA polymerase specialized sigma24 family protein